jgi:hypothetical protein
MHFNPHQRPSMDWREQTGTARISSRALHIAALLLLAILLTVQARTKEEVLNSLKGLGHGSYLFGQMATWVHGEKPDMDHRSNWLKKTHDHTGIMPAYGCLTYDFDDDPFTDAQWNEGVEKKRQADKVIWWAELGIRDQAGTPRDCLDVVKKLDEQYPELAGFNFWSDEGFYNVVGNRNGKELMTDPRIITLVNSKDRLKSTGRKSK